MAVIVALIMAASVSYGIINVAAASHSNLLLFPEQTTVTSTITSISTITGISSVTTTIVSTQSQTITAGNLKLIISNGIINGSMMPIAMANVTGYSTIYVSNPNHDGDHSLIYFGSGPNSTFSFASNCIPSSSSCLVYDNGATVQVHWEDNWIGLIPLADGANYKVLASP